MKFNSQICTTKEQSERLLALGLKKETADMCINPSRELVYSFSYSEALTLYDNYGLGKIMETDLLLPAWSLHRLLEMLSYQVIYNDAKYEPVIAIDGMAYQDVCNDDSIVGWSGDLYTDIIDCIEWLISIEQFNIEYLK